LQACVEAFAAHMKTFFQRGLLHLFILGI
jgi:hypothetical protein